MLLWTLFHPSLGAEEAVGQDGVTSNVTALSKNEVINYYIESTTYTPAGWEAVGGKFLNSTRNNKPVNYTELVDGNGKLSVDKIRARYQKCGILSIFSACLFCIMGPCFSICCIFKKRNRFLSNSGERYKLTAQILLFVSVSLFMAFSILAVVSSNNLKTSMDVIVKSVGAVYVGGLNFTTISKNVFENVLGDMAGFATIQINDFEATTINTMISGTQANLLLLSNNLKTQFILTDASIGNVASSIVGIDNSLTNIKTQVTAASAQYTLIRTNITALDNNFQTLYSNNGITFRPDQTKALHFALNSFPGSLDTSSVNSLPTNLKTTAIDLNSTQGTFGAQAAKLTSGMSSALANVRTFLQTKFADFHTLINSGSTKISDLMSKYYKAMLLRTDPIEVSFEKYNPKYVQFSTGRVALMAVLMTCIFGIIVFSLLCIRVKQRRIAMSLSSCLFLVAAICMALSVVHFVFALAMTEVCDQLKYGFPILDQVNAAPSISAIASAGFATVDMCSAGETLETILESPTFAPYIGNYTDYLNITLQYQILMNKINLTAFTDALNSVNLTNIIDMSVISNATSSIKALDFTALNIPTAQINTGAYQNAVNLLNSGVSSADNTQFTYTGIPTNPEKDEGVQQFKNKFAVNSNGLAAIGGQLNTTNAAIDTVIVGANNVLSGTNVLKNEMTNITDFIARGVVNFTMTIDQGKADILTRVNKMPPQILALVVQQYDVIRDRINCTILGQTLKVMEYEICSRFRDSLNGMWLSLWTLSYVMVIAFIAMHYSANILFRKAVAPAINKEKDRKNRVAGSRKASQAGIVKTRALDEEDVPVGLPIEERRRIKSMIDGPSIESELIRKEAQLESRKSFKVENGQIMVPRIEIEDEPRVRGSSNAQRPASPSRRQSNLGVDSELKNRRPSSRGGASREGSRSDIEYQQNSDLDYDRVEPLPKSRRNSRI